MRLLLPSKSLAAKPTNIMSTEWPKLLSSTSIIRFQDCDPYNHMNHAAYLNYFLNAREDQVLRAYGLDIYHVGKSQGLGWVVAQNQIAYVQPAMPMEEVLITSKIVQFGSRTMTVEFQMLDDTNAVLKSIMWSKFVHFDLRKGASIPHNEEFMEMFEKVLVDLPAKDFNERLQNLKNAPVAP